MLRVGQFTPQLKLLYHADKINDWVNGKNVYPVLVEFDLSNACNQRCNFCTFKYIKNRETIQTDVAIRTIGSLAENGVRAINWTGGGEPLIHKDFEEISRFAFDYGLRQGLFTNGVLLSKDNSFDICYTHDWVRVSLDAGNAETYQKIRGTDDFDKVINNVRYLLEVKKDGGLDVDIGLGFVVTPENFREIPQFANLVHLIGCDYGQIKPCINNFQHDWQYESTWWSKEVIPLIEECSRWNPKIVVNDYKFKELLNYSKDRGYEKCYGHIFCPCVGATGDVWLCTHMRDIQKYSLGNLYEQSFEQIWEGDKRQQVINAIDFSKCQFCCKNHEINKALYPIKHPETRKHGDFL